MNTPRTDQEIADLLAQSQALLDGHFILSSGLHSDKYVQCARFFQYPRYAEVAALKLKQMYQGTSIDLVAGGAFGGIIIAQEIARVLGVRAVFAERVEGVFTLRRGFEIQPGERVLIAEDVITTGKSIGEMQELVQKHQGIIAGVASLIDRGRPEPEKMGLRIEWLHSVVAEAYPPDALPDWLTARGPGIKPGSRGQK